MTEDQARIVLLEDALQQAVHTTTFLHNCLLMPGYSYGYPDQTLRNLRQWEQLVPGQLMCVHSFHKEDCASCQQRAEHFTKLAEAREILGCNE